MMRGSAYHAESVIRADKNSAGRPARSVMAQPPTLRYGKARRRAAVVEVELTSSTMPSCDQAPSS